MIFKIQNDSHFWEAKYEGVGSGFRGTYYVAMGSGEWIWRYVLCTSTMLICVILWLRINLLTFYSTWVQRRKSLVVKWMQVMLKEKNVLLYWCVHLSCLQKVPNFGSIWDNNCFCVVFNFCHRKKKL